ncbi:MAG: class IV adenylate cyclase [Phycisphaerae bacterium]|nr:class IV adenylate cyclase [Phycisphaerae bacterium]
MRNIEFKAELRDLPLARGICAALGAVRVGRFEQTDTYYSVPAGRLKKRECPGEAVEYIRYERPDSAAARPSDFAVFAEGEFLERFGRSEIPVRAIVRKARELFLIENVRIHLDEVEGLGTFLEFEAQVGGGHDERACRAALARLREAFAPALGEPVARSYCDLVEGA